MKYILELEIYLRVKNLGRFSLFVWLNFACEKLIPNWKPALVWATGVISYQELKNSHNPKIN